MRCSRAFLSHLASCLRHIWCRRCCLLDRRRLWGMAPVDRAHRSEGFLPACRRLLGLAPVGMGLHHLSVTASLHVG